MSRLPRVALSILPLVVACTSGEPSAVEGEGGADASVAASPLVGPHNVVLPPGYDGSRPVPLLVFLHPFYQSGDYYPGVLGLFELAASEGILLALPDGTAGESGAPHWNATDACCEQPGDPPERDDVAYLDGVLDDLLATYKVDASRVWVVGYSNGGFMAHAWACASADRIAAAVSFGGAQWKDPERCAPSAAISVLQIHGTHDPVVLYGGGPSPFNGRPYPSAEETVRIWADENGCTGGLVDTGARAELENTAPSDLFAAEGPDAPEDRETQIWAYEGCPKDIGVELWKVAGGANHLQLPPSLRADAFAERLYGFLRARRRQ